MKRTSTSTQKVTLVPLYGANESLSESFSIGKLSTEVTSSIKPVSSEVNLRFRTSAAMIGLALSMGTSSILLHQQTDEAMAAEAQSAEPIVTKVPATADKTTVIALTTKVNPEVANISPFPAVESKVSTVSVPIPGVFTQKPTSGQTLWQPSANPPVNTPTINSTGGTNKALTVSAVNAPTAVQNPYIASNLSNVQSGVSESSHPQKTASTQPPLNPLVNIADNTNNQINPRQDAAIKELKKQPPSWTQTLTDLKSQTAENTSTLPTDSQRLSAVNLSPQQPSPAGKSKEVGVIAIQPQAEIIPIKVINPTSTQPKPLNSTAVVTPNTTTLSQDITVDSVKPLTVRTDLQNPDLVKSNLAGTGVIYQVKSGDTLDSIAKTYGISAVELMQVNQINDAHQLRIHQKLKIPHIQSPSLFPRLAHKVKGSAIRVSAEVNAPTLAAATLSSGVVAPVSNAPVYSPKTGISHPPLEFPTVANTRTLSPVLLANNVEPSISPQADAQSNAYVEKLRGEIVKLREQYQAQKEGSQPNIPVNITVPTVTRPVTPAVNNTGTSSEYINPEFSPSAYNEALQREKQKQQQSQPTSQGAIPIRVEVPPTNSLQSYPQSVVASAPVGAENYNSTISIPVGRPVSPEIPSMSSPENNFLPGDVRPFNGYIWPTKGVLTSGFGWRWGRMHKGIDIAAPIGTPVVAAAPGVVTYARWNSGGYGNLVEVQHPDGSLTRYAHNNRILVREGQLVEQGEQLSEMGSTGHSTGPHCHFEVHPAGKGAVNPIAFLPHKF